MKHRRTMRLLAVLAGLALLGAACGEDSPQEQTGQSGDDVAQEEDITLTIYSGRDEEFVGPLLDRFEQTTGITLEVRYGDSAELAATILEEGDSSPADVFWAQDAGSLGAVAAGGLFQELGSDVLDPVDARFRSQDGLWVGTSGRARVAAYNTDVLTEQDLPASIHGFTDPEWSGRIGFPPTNSSFQAFVAGMIETEGEDATRDFLEGLVANDPRLYEDNSSTVRAVAAEEVEVGFVNHYYIYEIASEDGDIPVANHFFTGGDPGALVNTAGVGIVASTDAAAQANELLAYLTGDEGQRFFAEETLEYPVVDEYEPQEDLPALEEIRSPEIDLSDLANSIEPALRLLAEVGLL